jgi:NlpC/P60 family putative phage cell wall peptidase
MLNVTIPRQRIVAAARGWLGTPYHHQASLRGVGSDCLGLIRGLWREIYGEEPEAMPAYTTDWGSATGSETLLAAASRHLIKLEDVSEAMPGDVLVFRMRDQGVAKHAGILTGHSRLVHAQEGLGVVEISSMQSARAERSSLKARSGWLRVRTHVRATSRATELSTRKPCICWA